MTTLSQWEKDAGNANKTANLIKTLRLNVENMNALVFPTHSLLDNHVFKK